MIKRLIVICLAVLALIVAKPALAQEAETCVEVTQYGEGVGIVCGAKHEVVDTGLADINPAIMGSILITVSGFIRYYSTRKGFKIEGVTK